MGMLATLINSMALQAELEKQGIKTELLSGLAIEPICKEMSRRRAIEAMEEGKVVVIGGGSGNPFFTTDTASALRAVEIKADVILKGTRVDGVYTADPKLDPTAEKYDEILNLMSTIYLLDFRKILPFSIGLLIVISTSFSPTISI